MSDYLISIVAYTGSGTETFRYSGGGCVYSGNYYEPRVKNPGSLKILMFAEGTTRGRSQTGYGEVQLINTDGGLDAFLNYGFDGRSITISELLDTGSIGISWVCFVEQVVFENDLMTIRIKDPQFVFNKSVQDTKYAGSNTLPNGTEGTQDIQGQPKPLTYGEVFNITPVLVNTSRLIYQVNDGTVTSIPAVYDRGISLTLGSAYASESAMFATEPLPGYYRCWLAGGMFRLGATPAGTVTCDVVQGAAASDRTAAQIAKLIMLRKLSSGDLVAADFTTLDTANSSICGIYIKDETTIGDALDEVLGSVGAWYAFNSAGKLGVGRLTAPTGSAVASLTSSEILELTRMASNDTGRGIPAYKVNTGYKKNYTVQRANEMGYSRVSDYPWVTATMPSYTLYRIAGGNGIWVAFPVSGASYATSPDGITWTARTITGSPTCTWECLAFAGDKFIAFGSGPYKLITSTDGITWTTRTAPTAVWKSIAYDGTTYVAVGTSTTTAISSTDGITWTNRTTPTAVTWQSVTWGNGLFVAIQQATGTATMRSADGITWTAGSITSNDYKEIAYGAGVYVAVGTGSSLGKIFVSNNGTSWTACTVPSGITSIIHVVFGNGIFFAVASTNMTLLYSLNGVDWAIKTLGMSGFGFYLGYSMGVFVGTNPTASSYTGVVCDMISAKTRGATVNNEYARTIDTDAAIKTTYLESPELKVDTLLTVAANAATEATRLLSLYKVRRDFILCRIKRTAITVIPNIGQIVSITYPRYGYTSGKLFAVLGFNLELETNDLSLFLWG